ncbi:MAG: radical SAM protein [Alphaproteobacteria bacterium]|nr:radical SAM protein [Alphaproteobacteria bacterium]
MLDAAERRVLGDDTQIVVNAHDETNTVVPVARIIDRIKKGGGNGIVCMVGVQSNQFLRAMHLAQKFVAADIQVAIGGFHVSGCLAMLDKLTLELGVAVKRGITLFGGEAEGRLDEVLRDAHRGELKPIYDHLGKMPDLRCQPTPFLPLKMLRRTSGCFTSFDAGRGCPFNCSFCCIINVQGRVSRFREADKVEAVIRANAAQGVTKYFITDDNFARNRNWEPILDRLIELREREGLAITFIIQADMLSHRIPGFIEKAVAAGCRYVFLGLESVNPENLASANKKQNQIGEYRRMLVAWKRAGVVTIAGYILGFPADTPASIRRDIATVQREIPIDLLEFFVLSPAPGSADHKRMYEGGTWIDPDLNKGDAEHVVTDHPRMSREEWQAIYHEAWELYYTDEHIETLVRRALACGMKPVRLVQQIWAYSGIPRYEGVHPLQGGLIRRKRRADRRPGYPRDTFIKFNFNRLIEFTGTNLRHLRYALRLHRMRHRIERELKGRTYSDEAITLEPEVPGKETAPPPPLPIDPLVARSSGESPNAPEASP